MRDVVYLWFGMLVLAWLVVLTVGFVVLFKSLV